MELSLVTRLITMSLDGSKGQLASSREVREDAEESSKEIEKTYSSLARAMADTSLSTRSGISYHLLMTKP